MIREKATIDYQTKIEILGPLKFIIAIVGPQEQQIDEFKKYMQENHHSNAQMNSKNDIHLVTLIILFTRIIDNSRNKHKR
jgi:hypothetical protein